MCLPFDFNFYRNHPGDIQCEYYISNGACKDYLQEFDHPVKFALPTNQNFSDREAKITKFFSTVLNFHGHLEIHHHCYNILLRFVCQWVYFPTCDPAYNLPVSQHVCRRACEILTLFECPEAWTLYLELRPILDVPQGNDSSSCDNLMYANGGDIPDCTDPLDGGEFCIGYWVVE